MFQKLSDKTLFILMALLLVPTIIGSFFFRAKFNSSHDKQQRILVSQELKYRVAAIGLQVEKWRLNEKSNSLSNQVYPIFDEINTLLKALQYGGRFQNISTIEEILPPEIDTKLKKTKEQLTAYETNVKNLWRIASESADSNTDKSTLFLEEKAQLNQSLTSCTESIQEISVDLNTLALQELTFSGRVIIFQIIILFVICLFVFILFKRIQAFEANDLFYQADALTKQENLNKITDFIKQISVKNYSAPYSNDDILGTELIMMRDNLAKSEISIDQTISGLEDTKKNLEDKNFQLQQAEEEMRVLNEELSIRQRYIEEQNSTRINVVKLDEFLRSNFNKDLTEFGDLLMAEMAKQTGCAQAILYIISAYESTTLELVGGYACERDKLSKTVKLGEGLIGQAAKSLKFMEFSNIKSNYTSLSTGLVSITPYAIIIVPLEQNGIPQGAIELSFMEQPTEQTIQFLKACNQSISSILINIVNTSRTKRLLEEYQHISEQLQAQTEELRQNAEEMLATQEEFKRTRDEEIRKFEREINELKSQLEKYQENS